MGLRAIKVHFSVAVTFTTLKIISCSKIINLYHSKLSVIGFSDTPVQMVVDVFWLHFCLNIKYGQNYKGYVPLISGVTRGHGSLPPM